MTGNYTPIDDLIKRIKNKTDFSASFTGKESEPFVFRKPVESREHTEIKEVVEKGIEDKEVEPYVEVKKEKIELDESLKKAGLRPVTGTIKFPDYRDLRFPISDEKVLEGLHAPVNSSLRWLSEFILYILKKFHIHLKRIHGKVVRVLEK